jgi:hypothetical protein
LRCGESGKVIGNSEEIGAFSGLYPFGMGDGSMVAIEENESLERVGVVRVELEYSIHELKQLISQLPGRHPLVTELKRQLKECVDSRERGFISTGINTLTYLANKLRVSSMEQLFSKSLSFVQWGVELEERGFEVQAVKRGFFSREVIKLKIGGN